MGRSRSELGFLMATATALSVVAIVAPSASAVAAESYSVGVGGGGGGGGRGLCWGSWKARGTPSSSALPPVPASPASTPRRSFLAPDIFPISAYPSARYIYKSESERRKMSRKKVVESAMKSSSAARKVIDWKGMGKLLVSDEAKKEFVSLRWTFDEVNHELETKFSQIIAAANEAIDSIGKDELAKCLLKMSDPEDQEAKEEICYRP